MAIAHNGTDSKAKTTSIGTTLSWSHTVSSGSDQILIVSFGLTSDVSVTSVTFGGTGLTRIGTGAGTTSRRVETWRLLAPTASTNTVAITITTDSRLILGFAACYTGVHQTVPTGTADASTGSSTTPTSGTITSAADELIVATVVQHRGDNVEGLTVGGSQTSRGEDSSTDSVVWAHSGISDKTGAASTTMSYTSDTNDIWAIHSVPLKPAATPATGFSRNLLLLGAS